MREAKPLPVEKNWYRPRVMTSHQKANEALQLLITGRTFQNWGRPYTYPCFLLC